MATIHVRFDIGKFAFGLEIGEVNVRETVREAGEEVTKFGEVAWCRYS
jgi:hypothetical protein